MKKKFFQISKNLCGITTNVVWSYQKQLVIPQSPEIEINQENHSEEEEKEQNQENHSEEKEGNLILDIKPIIIHHFAPGINKIIYKFF